MIFERFFKPKDISHPDVLDEHLIEGEEFLEVEFLRYIDNLKSEYKETLDKIDFANLDILIPIFVLMKTLDLDESSAIHFNEKSIAYDQIILEEIGFKDGGLLNLTKQARQDNESFNKKLEQIFYFTMLDFAKDVVQKIDKEKLLGVYSDKNKLQEYIFSLVEDKGTDFYLGSFSASHNKIISGLKKI